MAADDLNHVIDDASREIMDLYDNAPCGYHSLDADGLVVQINATELEWLGYAREEVLGKMHFRDFIPEEHRHTFDRGFAAFKERGTLNGVEAILQRKDGTTFPVVVTSKAVRDENGNYVKNRSTLFDLTERQAAEQLVKQARDEAEKANVAKSEFLSRMSHELRTPLNAILGFAQVLELEDHGEAVSRGVQHISRAGRHLLAMINEVLDLSRIDTGTLSMSLEPVRLGPVLGEAIALVRTQAQSSGVDVALDPEQDEICVFADRQRLKQILINLISNAIKYNVTGGSVRVSTRLDEHRARISVADTGLGISPEHVRSLFAPFARLGAESLGIEGTGLGLSLSRGLAECMRGTITYHPNQPAGSVFTVEVGHAGASAGGPEDDSLGAGTRLFVDQPARILLIEDNDSNVELVKRVVGDCGEIELLVALTGADGIEIAQAKLPDVVLLDVNLPDISGLQVLKALRSDGNLFDVPVLVTSADATERQISAMLQAGANEYLTKPLSLERLYGHLDEILNHRARAAA